MALVMIAGASFLFLTRETFGSGVADMVREGLQLSQAQIRDTDVMMQTFGATGLTGLVLLAPLLAVVTMAAVLGGVALGGFAFSPAAMAPKLSKLNPLKGLKRVFGVRGLMEVGKSLGKAGVVGGCGLLFLAWVKPSLMQLGAMPMGEAVGVSGVTVAGVLVMCSVSLLLIAAVDVPFQLWNHNKQLRMTRREVQDELKETEGRPEVRSRVRAMQQELARQRMLEQVPEADVVVTNPSHFSVALKYDEVRMKAPQVVASGMDLVAGRIRAIAEAHQVPIFEAPLLARALFWNTKPGQQIPPQLYMAVAQVLTYIYRLRAVAEAPDAVVPERPEVEVDPELARPAATRRPGRLDG